MSDEELLCLRCGKEISKTEYEDYNEYCQECYEIEGDELDHEDGC